MDEKTVFSRGSFFHGTRADLKVGDLIVTGKKFPGNPTKSYRSKHPLKIVAEVIKWEGHSPEILNTMLENLRKLSEQGIKAID